jgi:hypothetical protein
MAQKPVVQLDENGKSLQVRYDIPDATTLTGKNYIQLKFENDPFIDITGAPPPPQLQRGNFANMLPRRDDDGGGGGGTVEDPYNSITLGITSPVGAANIVGPQNGVVVLITGTAKLNMGDPGSSPSINKIKVKLNGIVKDATMVSNSWSKWEVAFTVTTQGLQSIIVEAEADEAVWNPLKRNFNVELSIPPVENPPEAIQFSITNPAANSVFQTQDDTATPFTIKGTARHPKGIASIHLEFDSAPGAWIPINIKEPVDGVVYWETDPITLRGNRDHVIRFVAKSTDASVPALPSSLTVKLVQSSRVYMSRGLYVVETYRIANYLGNYGAGRVIKTFTLLPGEKTKIGVKSYRKQETTEKTTNSIFDSTTDKAVEEFQQNIGDEQTEKGFSENTTKLAVEASGGMSIGLFSVGMTAKAEASFNASREETAKRTLNAVNKHAQERNAIRNITINTESENKLEATYEESIERELTNINVSRTLNFVFRQMNQEYINVLNLVDVQIAYIATYFDTGKDELQYEHAYASIPELSSLMSRFVKEDFRASIEETIMKMLTNIVDAYGNLHSIVEEYHAPLSNISYWRINRKLTTPVQEPDPAKPGQMLKYFDVQGIVLGMQKIVLRTEGVYVESVLGAGEALDEYSRGIQTTTVQDRLTENEKQKLSIEQQKADVEQRKLALEIIRTKNKDQAELYTRLFPPKKCCQDDSDDNHKNKTGKTLSSNGKMLTSNK